MQPEFKNTQHEIGRLRGLDVTASNQFWKDINNCISKEQQEKINNMMNDCDSPEPSPEGQKRKIEIINSLTGDAQRYAIGWYTFQ